MRLRLATLLAGFALFAAPALAAEPCPPLPEAPRFDASTDFMLPKNPRQVPAPRRHTSMPEGPLAGVRIKLTRAHCRETCELNSSVELRGDGGGVYRGGDSFVLVRGEHNFTLAPGVAACLVEAVRAADFWSLAPAYMVDEPAIEIVTLDVEIAGQRKSVQERRGDRVGAPAALLQLALAVEAARPQSYLVGDAQTVPMLQADHFDFRSRAGAVLLARAVDLSPDDVVLAILAQGAPANQKVWINGLSHHSAIATASHEGKLDLVRALIAAGAFQDAPYEMREDALRAAIEGARPAVVDELIRSGADLRALDEEGGMMLAHLRDGWEAGRESDDPTLNADRVAVIKRLLAAGAPVPPDILFKANTPEELRLFLAAGADLEARRSGETPLLATEDEDMAIALLEAGADRQARDEDGKTITDKVMAKDADMPRVLVWVRAHR